MQHINSNLNNIVTEQSTIDCLNHRIDTNKKNRLSSFVTISFSASILFISAYANNSDAALSATTANTIQGTAPFLSFDGTIKTNNTEDLLTIKLSNGLIYEHADAAGTVTAPITLPSNDKFEDIITYIPAGSASASLTTVFGAPNNFAQDDDGDGNFTATGTLSVSIKDVNGDSINLNDAPSPCKTPYKFTITSTAGTLSTQYGAPNTSTFNGSSATYTLKDPGTTPAACFARPNLRFGDDTGGGINGALGKSFAGPATQWDITKGFKLQDINTPQTNFPTIGFNGAFFELDLVNATAGDVIAGSGVTVNSVGASNLTLNLSTVSANVVKVQLSGPSSGQTAGLGPISTAGLPATFIIKSLKAGVYQDIYSFTISKWFIPQNGPVTSYNGGGNDAISYCASLPGFRLADIGEFTNANASFASSCTDGTGTSGNGQPVASCIDGNYKRTIGGGVFAEWGLTTGGATGYYSKSDWESAVYWTGQGWSNDYQYLVVSEKGEVNHTNLANASHRAACVTP